jgi:hypothetical protein
MVAVCDNCSWRGIGSRGLAVEQAEVVEASSTVGDRSGQAAW